MARPTKEFRRALALASRPKENWVELCQLLAAVVDQDPRLREQFEQQAGMDNRTVYYFLKFGRQLRRLNLPQEQLTKVGWTKFEAISPRLTRTNANRLLALAEEKTVPELKAELRGAGYKQKPRRMILTFDPLAYVKIERALLMHGARRSRGGRGKGLENKEAALLKLIEKATTGEPQDD
jgi:hypothetical protein